MKAPSLSVRFPARSPGTASRWPAWLVAGATTALLASACAGAVEEPFRSGLAERDAAQAEGSSDAPAADPDCDDANPRPSLGPPEPLPAPASLPAGSYMAEIQARGVLRAGVGADTLLFGFLNPQSGDVEGFDVEMARLVADAIFGDPDRLELIPVQSAERIDRLQDGTVDIVVKTMTINCERWGSINFSTVYYESGQRLLVGNDTGVVSIDDVGGERAICAISGTTSLARLEAEGVATIEEASWTDCLVAFQQGRAFGISTDDTILAGLAAQDPYAEVVGAPFSEEPYGIGLPKDHPEFTRFVNAVLEQARSDGTWERLYDEWLADVLGKGVAVPNASYRT
ncbi:MAG: transporter substrate-binding domain-containing protein [Acidimicrobiia bacterium]|nr:transporter substrate-binding domain-containing protein [Acidimicrobiia bacterium]